MRETFIAILKSTPDVSMSDLASEMLTDHLIKNGAIIFPCKIGDTVYFVYETCNEAGDEFNVIDRGTVHSIYLDKTRTWIFCRYESGLSYHHKEEDFGKTIFLTKTDAEKVLNEG